MQMINYDNSLMQPTDFNQLINDAAIRRMNQAKANSLPEILKQNILALHLKNQIDAPNAEHAEEITMADLRNKIAETYMKHMQGGLFGAEANKANIESQYLPAKSRAEIADKLANTNFLRAQTTNEMYKNNPNLAGYAGLNNFMQDKQIDPRIRAMALGGQSDSPSQMNGTQIPFRQGYSPSNGQGNNSMQGNPLAGGMGLLGNNSALQSALMTPDQIKLKFDIQKKNEEIKAQGNQDFLKEAYKKSEISKKMLEDLKDAEINYELASKDLISGVGPTSFLTVKPNSPLSALSSPYAQAAYSALQRVIPAYGALEVPSASGKGISQIGLQVSGLAKPNIGYKDKAFKDSLNATRKMANIYADYYPFINKAIKNGHSVDEAKLMWINRLNTMLGGK